MRTFDPTPIQLTDVDACRNRFFIKRDDMLPFCFGGNKLRIALCYLWDFHAKGCTHMIVYGNARSNLCRVMANLCSCEGIPITVLCVPDDDGKYRRSINAEITRGLGAKIMYTDKQHVPEAVDRAMDEARREGGKPYYIYGDRYGKGNEAVPTAAYVPVYDEICGQGKYDVIAVACGTGVTLAGLLCGQQKRGGTERIIGLSIARDSDNARAHIVDYADAYLAPEKLNWDRLEVYDQWRETYGGYGPEVRSTIYRMMTKYSIPMDGTYTGKAYCALRTLSKEQNWQNKDVLFIHTGGTPLYFDRFVEQADKEWNPQFESVQGVPKWLM